MEHTSLQKFYPSAEELSTVRSKVKCSQINCNAVFLCTSNLNMHLIKHHGIKNEGLTQRKATAQYFCPVPSCPYYKDTKKHFTKLKYLKQHYLKVHALKGFICQKCKKKFSTKSFLGLHTRDCGKIFTCTCGSAYSSSEAVLTHIKRKGKGHEILINNEINKINKNLNKKNESSTKKERFIYPKLTGDVSFPVQYIAAVALSELSVPQNVSKTVDKGVQTEVDLDSNRDQMVKSNKKRKNSQETQTTSGKSRKQKISTQTQTNNDYLKRKGKTPAKTISKRRKKSMETQTKDQLKITENDKIYTNQRECIISVQIPVTSKIDKKYKEMLNADELVKLKNKIVNVDEEKWLWEMVSSSSSKTTDLDLMPYSNVSPKSKPQCETDTESQVNQVFDLNKLCNIETQTDIDAFLTECNEDTNFTLCSTTETQTTDDFDCLLYSNMCTQTCEEVDQLFNFNFVHNETQTAWPDLNDCHELDSQ